MSDERLHNTREEHEANPPSSWTVVKVADRCWRLQDARGVVLATEKSRMLAEEARTTGYFARMYEREGEEFAAQA